MSPIEKWDAAKSDLILLISSIVYWECTFIIVAKALFVIDRVPLSRSLEFYIGPAVWLWTLEGDGLKLLVLNWGFASSPP